jgi:sulfur carrier protein
MQEQDGAGGERIRVNGETRPLLHRDLMGLLEEMGYSRESRGVAVAVNDEVVPRARWKEHRLAPGDSVEIVSAVQGG